MFTLWRGYAASMACEVVFTPEAEAWWKGLSQRDAERIGAALDLLQEHGPVLGRPAVDSIHGSRHHNMKELRSFGGHLRALFAFDQGRRAVILAGGDKTGDWRGWYRRMIPVADRRYDLHVKRGGEGRWRAGERSGARER